MHQSQLHSDDELKKCLLDVWHIMDHRVTDDTTDEWHKRLQACVCEKEQLGLVNLTIASSTEPCDKVYFVSSSMTFVICRKFELLHFIGSMAIYFGCSGIYRVCL